MPLSRDLDVEFHRQPHHSRTPKSMTFVTPFEPFAMGEERFIPNRFALRLRGSGYRPTAPT